MKLLLFITSLSVLTITAFAEVPSDADIASAMQRGNSTPSKKLWEEIRKHR
jgi:hypothetical protein